MRVAALPIACASQAFRYGQLAQLQHNLAGLPEGLPHLRTPRAAPVLPLDRHASLSSLMTICLENTTATPHEHRHKRLMCPKRGARTL